MTTAYTSLLGLALPVTGELSGTWGDTVNNSITSLLDSAIAGTTTITVDDDVTLTTTTGSANTSRQAIILWNPASGTTTRNITVPAQSKIYTVINASGGTQSIVLRGAGPTSGVTIAKGESALCAWNGSDFIKISNTAGPGTFTNLTVTGNTSLGDADTDTITQAASYVTGTQLKSAKTATNTLSLAAYDVDGAAYTNLITLTASNTPTLALTSTGVGTINNMSIGATTASTGAFTTLSASSTVTLSGGTINGVAFLNGSNVLTTGSALVFDGTNLGVGGTQSYSGYRTLLVQGTSPSTGGVVQIQNSDSSVQSYWLNTSNLVSFGSLTSTPLAFLHGNAEKMRLTSTSLYTASGINLLVGSTSSFGVVNGEISVKAASGGAGVALWDAGVSSKFQLIAGAGGVNAFGLYDISASAYRWTVDSSGNLGVGTSSPAGKLTVDPGNSSGTQIDGLRLPKNLTAQANFLAWQQGGNGWRVGIPYNDSAYSLAFFYGASTPTASSPGTQVMTLDASGNLGIGTTSPSTKLDVVGVVRATGAGPSVISVEGSSQLYAAVQLQATSSGGKNWSLVSNATSSPLGAAGSLSFRDSSLGVTHMTLDSSGNLLVGPTSVIGSKLGIQTQGGNGIAYLVRHTSATAGKYRIFAVDSSNNGLFYDQNNVGMYMADAGTSWIATSDESQKVLTNQFTGAIEFLSTVRATRGRYKTDDESISRSFLIAQDWQEYLPEAISEKDGILGLSYQDTIPVLVKAIQELTARITALEGA